MRLPAVAIAAAFACGIALGLHLAPTRNASSHFLLSSVFIFVGVLILTRIIFVGTGRVLLASVASILTWVLLGFLGACIAEQPREANHVVSLLEQGRLPSKTPLRWHGRLRDEPAQVPWRYGYEIELSGVEFAEALHPARGGLRLSFTVLPGAALPPVLHAGDEVVVLTEAKRPQVFRDEGAFDRRKYLAQQNIDLVATLRAPGLIERIASPSPTIGTVLARARRRLRDEIDELFAHFGASPFAGTAQTVTFCGRKSLPRRSLLQQRTTILLC